MKAPGQEPSAHLWKIERDTAPGWCECARNPLPIRPESPILTLLQCLVIAHSVPSNARAGPAHHHHSLQPRALLSYPAHLTCLECAALHTSGPLHLLFPMIGIVSGIFVQLAPSGPSSGQISVYTRPSLTILSSLSHSISCC